MAGDFSDTIYRENSFIFIKVIQSIFRGTIDNFEFTNDYRNDLSSSLQLLSNSKNQYERIYNKIGAAGYCLFLVHYLLLFLAHYL